MMSISRRSRGRRPQTFIFLGLSGSGKDTQAASLLRVLGRRSKHISTGDGLRRMARMANRVGRYVDGVLQRGGLMPVWTPVYVWLSAFAERLSGEEDVVFSGSPRRVDEALLLDGFMRDLGRALPRAIYLKLSERAARERLLERGRYDDNGRAIRGRFQYFQEHVQPVITYYRRHGRLITINGDQPVPAVWRDIKRALRLR